MKVNLTLTIKNEDQADKIMRFVRDMRKRKLLVGFLLDDSSYKDGQRTR